MSRFNFVFCLVTTWATIAPLAVRAQDSDSAGMLYGEGVQAYFAGHSAEADSALSRSIAINPNDPRAFYFRALSRIQQGRQDEGRVDMQIGANLEARLPNRFEIGHTLQRVQGPTRLMLEQYRTSARIAAGMHPPAGPVRSPDTAVLRERRVVPLEEFSGTGEPRAIVAPDVPPPVVNPPTASAAKPTDNPSPAPAAATTPFGNDAAAADEPAPKAKPKTPPIKAATPAPAAPKPTAPAPKPSDDKDDNPF